jgi:hypothetical protein
MVCMDNNRRMHQGTKRRLDSTQRTIVNKRRLERSTINQRHCIMEDVTEHKGPTIVDNNNSNNNNRM